MQCAKGVSSTDGTYIYTCGKCNGYGLYRGDVCDWCYNLDTTRIIEEIKKGARGQRYYSLLKAFLSVNGKAIVDEHRRIKCENGKVVVVDIGYISLKFGLNLKATWEWLEETQCVYSGTYNHFTESKLKVSDVYKAAREKYQLANLPL